MLPWLVISFADSVVKAYFKESSLVMTSETYITSFFEFIVGVQKALALCRLKLKKFYLRKVGIGHPYNVLYTT